MKRRNILAPFALVAACAAMAGEIEDRFVYIGCNIGDKAHVDRVIDVVRRASKQGFNGLVVQGDIQYAWLAPERDLANLARLKSACDKAGMDLIPAIWSIGYGTMLWANPNLAAGLPVFDVPYEVSPDGSKAVFCPSPNAIVSNGDFEDVVPAKDGKGFNVRDWFVDTPGEICFVDKEAKASGRQSLRFELSASGKRECPQARAFRTIKVKPNHRYRVAARLRTEGLDTTYGFQIVVYTRPGKGETTGMTRQLTSNRPRIQLTNDWTDMTAEISTLGYTELDVFLGSWCARAGRFWLDDVKVVELGVDRLLRRPGCPLTVRDAATGKAYVEGRDFAKVPPLKKGQEALPRENGALVFSIPAGSRLKPGTKLLVSGYASHKMKSDSQVSVCMSEPELYELFEKSAAAIEAAIHPRKWFLPLDEIRAGGTCAACMARKIDMAHVFADCVTKMRATIKRVSPDAAIYIWGDNLLNKKPDCMCRESFDGSIDLVPKDIVVMHWGGAPAKTLKYFHDKGFRTARSFDVGLGWKSGEPAPPSLTNNYRIARETPGCRGFMYTTWYRDYSQDKLEAFGRLWDGAAAELPPEGEFAFRARLEEVHEPGLRDLSLKAAAGELELSDGSWIAFAGEPTPYMKRAIADFADFMKVSMGVTVSTKKSGGARVGVSIATGCAEKGYEVDVGAGGVSIRAKDDRQAAQALYHLEDLMGLRRAPFLKFGSERRVPLFSPRMAHSGWGCDQYPDSYLMKLQHTGIDTIILFMEKAGVASCNTHSGDGLKLDAAAFIRRMKDFGFDTYVYSQATGFKHPSDPDAPQFFDELYGGISKDCRGAKGYILVDEKCHFPSKDPRVCKWDPKTRKKVDPNDPRPYPSYFPGYDYLDWVDIVRRSLLRYSPEAEIVFWTYAFVWAQPEPCREFIRKLPKDMPVMATFESGLEHTKRNGLESRVEDYSIAAVGPGGFFRRQAGEACASGHKVYTMANCAGLAWDFGTIPYNPCPYQWRRRWDAVKDAQRDWNVRGVMECHHYGVWPSFITELEKEAFTEGGMAFDEHIRKIAARDFGEANAEKAVAAWRSWSEAIEDMPPRGFNQYGPFRMGPAYPFNAFQPEPEARDWFNGKKPMHVSPYSRGSCREEFDGKEMKEVPGECIKKELELFESMARRYFDGAAAFREIAASAGGRSREKALRMAYLGEYMARAVTTAKHVREGTLAERAGDREKAKALAALEHANTRAAIELMKRDSRLGWEPTMGYQGGVAACEWKLRRLERIYGVPSSK